MSNSVEQIAKDLLELSKRLELVSASARLASQSNARPPSSASQKPQSVLNASRVSQRSAVARSIVAPSTIQVNQSGSNASAAVNNSSIAVSLKSANVRSSSAVKQNSPGSATIFAVPSASAAVAGSSQSQSRSRSGLGQSALNVSASNGSRRSASNAPASAVQVGSTGSSRALSNVSRFSAGGSGGLSAIEEAVLRSENPIESSELDVLNVNGTNGLWLNKQEVLSWKGDLPIGEYPIHQDANPEIITKRSQQKLEYIQELAIRYLRPPTPPAPGEIVINQEPNKLTNPAPPVVIRQQPARPDTPEPLVIREAPPQPPAQLGRKVITVGGKRLPPPPRKVVIERLAPLPSKPQSVIIERWLPYSQQKRRVIFNRSNQPDPVVVTPRNVIVQWEAPEVNVRKEFKYLGVLRANPAEYVQRYGDSLVLSEELPQFVQDIQTPDDLVLAADANKSSVSYELEGDVEALKLVDLAAEGLEEYRSYLANYKASSSASRLGASLSGSVRSSSGLGATSASAVQSASVNASASAFLSTSAASQLNNLIETLFNQIDKNNTGFISVEDAEKLVLRLNSRLNRSYGEDDVKVFFETLDKDQDGLLNLEEFRSAFINIAL